MAMFYMPVKVYEESEAVKNHAADLAKFGKKALIVTGRRREDYYEGQRFRHRRGC